MKTVKTFTATIYVGFKEHDTGVVHDMDRVRLLCQQYVDHVGLCITVQPIEYIYTDGSEPGCVVGLINYPRFPAKPRLIRHHALMIAKNLMRDFRQQRCSVVFPRRTVMLTNEEVPQ